MLHSGLDITEHKLAEDAVRASEARLRALSARLESAREEEGRRIAREIHDELGGTLTALKWDLDGMAKSLSGPLSAGEAERIRKAVPGMVDLVESTMTHRAPDRVGPAARGAGRAGRSGGHRVAGPAVRGAHGHPVHLGRRRRRSGPRPRSRDGGLPDSPGDPHERPPPRTGLAGPRRDPAEADSFVLEVWDNGRGIEQDELAAARSLGLLGMRERALLVGGEVRIQGVAGIGTSVVVTIPLSESVTAPMVESV